MSSPRPQRILKRKQPYEASQDVAPGAAAAAASAGGNDNQLQADEKVLRAERIRAQEELQRVRDKARQKLQDVRGENKRLKKELQANPVDEKAQAIIHAQKEKIAQDANTIAHLREQITKTTTTSYHSVNGLMYLQSHFPALTGAPPQQDPAVALNIYKETLALLHQTTADHPHPPLVEDIIAPATKAMLQELTRIISLFPEDPATKEQCILKLTQSLQTCRRQTIEYFKAQTDAAAAGAGAGAAQAPVATSPSARVTPEMDTSSSHAHALQMLGGAATSNADTNAASAAAAALAEAQAAPASPSAFFSPSYAWSPTHRAAAAAASAPAEETAGIAPSAPFTFG